MVEIIIAKIEMPPYQKRRFQYNPIDLNGKKWSITDTVLEKIIYKGKYEETTLVCHNLNKKFYRDKN